MLLFFAPTKILQILDTLVPPQLGPTSCSFFSCNAVCPLWPPTQCNSCYHHLRCTHRPFTKATMSFMSLTANPTDNDLTTIHEILMSLLLGIIAGRWHNFVSLTAQLKTYKVKYSIFFVQPRTHCSMTTSLTMQHHPSMAPALRPPTQQYAQNMLPPPANLLNPQ